MPLGQSVPDGTLTVNARLPMGSAHHAGLISQHDELVAGLEIRDQLFELLVRNALALMMVELVFDDPRTAHALDAARRPLEPIRR